MQTFMAFTSLSGRIQDRFMQEDPLVEVPDRLYLRHKYHGTQGKVQVGTGRYDDGIVTPSSE
jgi:hypothetical protein